MRKPVLLRALAVALALAVVGCSGSDSGEEAERTFSPAPDVSNPLGECARNTRIGLVYDDEAQTAFKNGLDLAMGQLNQRGSFNYEPVIVAVRGMADEGVANGAEELASTEDVSAILTSARDEGAAASIDTARDAGVAILLVGASSDDVDLGNGAFSLRLSLKGEVDVLQDLARSELGFKDVEVVGFPGLVDSEGDYIVAPAPGQDPGALMDGVTEIVGPDSVLGTSQYVFTDAGDLPDGVHVGVPWYVDAPDPTNEDFGVAYEAEYGEAPSIDAAYGYTGVFLVAWAVESACSNERASVIKQLATTTNMPSPFGAFSFSKRSEPIHPLYLLKIENGTPTAP